MTTRAQIGAALQDWTDQIKRSNEPARLRIAAEMIEYAAEVAPEFPMDSARIISHALLILDVEAAAVRKALQATMIGRAMLVENEVVMANAKASAAARGAS